VRCLARQTAADRIELLLVVPSAAGRGDLPDGLGAFHSHRVIEIGPFDQVATGNTAGVRAATAELVVFAEDHSFPEPDWAAALIDRHREPWAAVGPVLRNANPATAVSWADFLMGFGQFAEPLPAGEVVVVAGHNSCFKREHLMRYGDRLEQALNPDWNAQRELRASGEGLFTEPRAVTRHLNNALMRPWVTHCFWAGWAAGNLRSAAWSPARRAVYALAWPLIAAVRLPPILRSLARVRAKTPVPRMTVPLLLVGLTIEALGQCAGHLTGGRGLAPRGERMREFGRIEHVPQSDRRALERV
jgi:hypothetical protein